jgi:hypothetical protein
MKVPVERRERPFAARPGGGEDWFELGTESQEADARPLRLGKCWV